MNKTSLQDIATISKDGMDIESHTMNHRHLNYISAFASNLEVTDLHINIMKDLIMLAKSS
jgi:peptidoglycan/xylan/chitin deacetylase (PgdA/CDA1 family)